MGDSRAATTPLPILRVNSGTSARVAGLNKKMNGSGDGGGQKNQMNNFIAGGIGGMVGATVTCPLEVIKTRLQSKELHGSNIMRQVGGIWKNEGVRGFWKGLGPMVVGVVPARATYFASYDATKTFCRSRGMKDGTSMYLMSAVVAGVATSTLINPIWVIKTRIQLQRQNITPHDIEYRSSLHAARKILAEEGWRGFFKGLVPSYWGISESALQFVLYEHLKQEIGKKNAQADGDAKGAVKSHEFIGAAGLSKFVAAVVTYPHEVIRTRMRERKAVYSSALQCVKRVWLEEGIRGMYGGMIPHLLRVVPNSAIIFFTYEHVSSWLHQLEEQSF